jgi:choline dehydrogenase-like flavoprotein
LRSNPMALHMSKSTGTDANAPSAIQLGNRTCVFVLTSPIRLAEHALRKFSNNLGSIKSGKYMTSVNSQKKYDVIIVGSGAGGAAAAYALVNAGLDVILIEKGSEIPHPDNLNYDQWAYQNKFKSKELWLNGKGHVFAPEEYFNLGGKTRWYAGGMLRYSKEEFDAEVSYQCPAWPVNYNRLINYYGEAENLLGVSCFECEPDLSFFLQRMHTCAPDWQNLPFPLALPADIQQRYKDAKGSVDSCALTASMRTNAESAFLARVRPMSNLKLMTNQTVNRLLPKPGNPTQLSGVSLVNGTELHARAVVLAAGALHSPRLLQHYVQENNLLQQLRCNENIGRNLKLHIYTMIIAFRKSPVTDFMRRTRLLLNNQFQHSRVEPVGLNANSISGLLPHLLPRSVRNWVGARGYLFLVQTEDGSHRDNRVVAESAQTQNMPVFDYDENRLPLAVKEHQQVVASMRKALKGSGCITIAKKIDSSVTAHACGTLMAGDNPDHSVVNTHTGQVHGLESLYVVDGSVLPRSGRMTPTLTIFAWSLMVSEYLAEKLKKS